MNLDSTLLPKVATSQIFLSSTYIVREHALAQSRVHLRQHGALSWARTCTHPWARITSLSFLRLLSKQFSCHLAIFSCHNKSQRAFLSKKKKKKKKKKTLERHVWCLDDVVRMPATRLRTICLLVGKAFFLTTKHNYAKLIRPNKKRSLLRLTWLKFSRAGGRFFFSWNFFTRKSGLPTSTFQV